MSRQQWGHGYYTGLEKGKKEAEANMPIYLQLEKAKHESFTSYETQKLNFLRKARDIIAHLPGTIERNVYCRKIADEYDVDFDCFLKEVNDKRKKLIRDCINEAFRKVDKSTR